MRLHAPQSAEGWQLWSLIERLGGQFRGVGEGVIGWDMTAALAMARALGVDEAVAADVLPEIEPAAVAGINKAIAEAQNG